jgi:DNA polymerase-1
MLMHYGLKECSTYFDTAVGQYVLDSSRSNYELKTMAYEYFRENIQNEKELMEQTGQLDMFTDPSEIYKDYGLKWCAAVNSLTPLMKNKIKEAGLETVAYEVEMPLIEVMASMEYEGVSVDETELTSLGSIIKSRIDEMTSQIHEYAGEEFNINSPKQLGVILFEKMGLTAGKKTKSGYSTSADILEKIADEHPIVPLILEYRTLTKLNSTYIEGLLPLITSEKKIHAHFNQTVTTTGRISCTEPNLQNIPIRQEFGRQIRKAFVPSGEGNMLVGADYSQIELRVLAHMADDQVLIDAFNNGEDIHRSTAANVLGVKPEDITVEERSRAKAVNFGVIYGMSSFGLSTELKITRKDAENYIRTYFDKHTAVKSFMDGQVEFCKENGFVTTMCGRKRYINEIAASNFMTRQMGERLAMNSPIQGSAADIIKIAMIKVYKKIKELNLKSKLVLQIHDELVVDCYPGESEIVKRILKEEMQSVVDLQVPLLVEVEEGKTLYDAK